MGIRMLIRAECIRLVGVVLGVTGIHGRATEDGCRGRGGRGGREKERK